MNLTRLVVTAALLSPLVLGAPSWADDTAATKTISKPDECSSVASSAWSPYERLAWGKLCNGLPIEGNCDSSNNLSASFLTEISRLPYSNFYRSRSVWISNVPIVDKDLGSSQYFSIATVIGRDIHLFLCQGVSSAQFNSISTEGDVEIVNEGGGVDILKIDAKNVEIVVGNNSMMTSGNIVGSLGFYFVEKQHEGESQSLTLLGTTVGKALTISDWTGNSKIPSQRRLEIDGDKIKEDVTIDHATSLRANRTKIGDVLTLDIDDGGDLDISLSELGTIEFDRNGSYVLFSGQQRISETKIGNLVADEEFPYIPFAKRNSSYNPVLYDIGAARLRELGAENAARNVQFYKNYEEIPELPPVYKIISYMKLISSGFGLYPEYGLYLFGFLILLLWIALRSGGTNSLVDPTKVPRSWFVFAVDSFIPIFSVDESFKSVEFRGWRHWTLYGARILGILFAFIILKVLEKLFETQ